MSTDRINDRVESLNERIDRVANAFESKEGGRTTGSDGDRRATRLFPYFLVFCAVFWVAVMVFIDEWTLAKAVEILCLVFVSSFAAIGFACVFFMDSGPFPKWVLFLASIAMSTMLWVGMTLIGNEQVVYTTAVVNMLQALGISVSADIGDMLGFSATVIIMFFTSSAVLYVTVAYLRTYMPRVFLTMDDHAVKGVRGKAERFFMVPDIIDVKEIVLDPEENDHIYNLEFAVRLAFYTMLLGVMVSSYLFVNPYFLDVMSPQTMLSIMMMLSMFVPVLIIPWLITREVGAKARSDAPRDYILWTGARRRLFSSFAALGAFMMMFLLSIYFGNDAATIFRNYVLFMVPLILTSIMYAIIYSNSFHKGLRNTIINNFEEGKQGRLRFLGMDC